MLLEAQSLDKRRLRQFCPADVLDKFEPECKKPQKNTCWRTSRDRHWGGNSSKART